MKFRSFQLKLNYIDGLANLDLISILSYNVRRFSVYQNSPDWSEYSKLKEWLYASPSEFLQDGVYHFRNL